MPLPEAAAKPRNGSPEGSPPQPWAGIVLAAGESRRMGRPKPLLPFGPGTVVEWILQVARRGGLEPLVVVLGHRAEEVAPHLPPGVTWVLNPDYREGGMLSSVQRGLAALPSEVAVAAILLGDQPTLTPEVLLTLREAWEADGRPADRFYLPTYRGQRGHPLCLPSLLFPLVFQWTGEEGLRGLLKERPSLLREVPVEEEGVLLDMDTPEDYQRALEWLKDKGAL